MLKFNSETHQYYFEIPSVSAILRATVFKDKYKNVPEHILQAAADFGTAIHDAIERDNDIFLDDLQKEKFNEYQEIKKENNIKIVAQEQMVYYDGDVKYAGRYDMLAEIDDELTLIDTKTTYSLDKKYISYQLSFYAMALERLGHSPKKLAAVWLPKRKKGKLVYIDRVPNERLLEVLREYEAISK